MPFKEITAVYSENNMNYVTTLRGQNKKELNVKAGGTYNCCSALKGKSFCFVLYLSNMLSVLHEAQIEFKYFCHKQVVVQKMRPITFIGNTSGACECVTKHPFKEKQILAPCIVVFVLQFALQYKICIYRVPHVTTIRFSGKYVYLTGVPQNLKPTY
jgi:hypothetical protein